MKTGLIGLGNMGRGLAKNMLENGLVPIVYDLNQTALQEAVDLGATPAKSVADIAQRADVIVTCLPSLSSIREIYLGTDGIVTHAASGTVAVDCSTSIPALTREIGESLTQAGIDLIDAPMLKTAKAAWDGTLHLAVGGDPELVDRVRPVLEAISEKIVPAGALGAGHALKLINNAMTLGTHVVVSEALTVAQLLDVDLDVVLEVGDASMASSNKLRELAVRLKTGDHSMAFATDVALKDMTAYGDMAVEAGAAIPAGQAAQNLLKQTSEAGYGDENASRVATLLSEMAETTRSS